MDQSNFEVQNETSVEVSETPSNKLNCKTLIVSLSVIALVLQIVSVISSVMNNGMWNVKDIISILNSEAVFFERLSMILEPLFELIFRSLEVLLRSFLLYVLPIVLFLVYILFFYPKRKAGFLIPIIFSIPLILVFIEIYYFSYLYLDDISNFRAIAELLWLLLFIAAVVILFVGSIKKKHKAKIMSISLIVLFSMTLIEFLFSVPYIVRSIMDYIFEREAIYIADNFFFIIYCFSYAVALPMFYFSQLLFVSKNEISSGNNIRIAKTNPEKEKEKIKNMSPEKALKALKKNFDQGIITEEEYNAQREEVMQRLYK